jgi:hypothetical protein
MLLPQIQMESRLRRCIQKFPDWVDNGIYAYLWYCSLLSHSKYSPSRLCNGSSVSATAGSTAGTDFLESLRKLTPLPRNQLTTTQALWQLSHYSDWAAGLKTGVRFPIGERKEFFSPRLCCSGARPASYPMSTGDSFSGSKATGSWSWPLPSIYLPYGKNVWNCISTPHMSSWHGT